MSDARDHARYADRDGAYVLGALSPAERREYETHLEACDRCRLAVAELSGMPGLLARVDADRAFSLLDAPDAADRREAEGAPDAEVAANASSPADLVARIERAERARRMRRLRIAGGIAAAVLLAAAIGIPVGIAAQPHPAVAVALAPAVTSPLRARVQLTSVAWGTRIDMDCSYGADGRWTHPDDEGDWSYSLWVVGASGAASELSTWRATSGSRVTLTAGTALPIGDIARVEVRSATTNDVLLAKDL